MASHLSWIARLSIRLAVLIIGGALMRFRDAGPYGNRAIQFSLGGFLATNELIWQAIGFPRKASGLPIKIQLVTFLNGQGTNV